MANLRVFEHGIKLLSDLVIPASAGSGKLWTSDSEGKGSWTAREKVKFVVEHGWAIEGKVSAGTSPGLHIYLSSGVEKKLIGIEYKYEAGSGTLVEFELRRSKKGEASEALTGFTALKAKKEEIKRTSPTAIALADEDFIYLKRGTVTGTCENFSATAFIEVIVS